MALNNNRINTKLTETQQTSLKTSYDLYQTALLAVSQNLTPLERKRLLKIDRVNRVFVEEAIGVLESLPELMPAYLNPADLRTDLELYTQMVLQESRLEGLLKQVQDTKALAGSEAYQAALSIYRLTEAAAKAGMTGAETAYQQLKERFLVETAPEETATPAAPAS